MFVRILGKYEMNHLWFLAEENNFSSGSYFFLLVHVSCIRIGKLFANIVRVCETTHILSLCEDLWPPTVISV